MYFNLEILVFLLVLQVLGAVILQYFSCMLQHYHMEVVWLVCWLAGDWEGRMDEDGQTDKTTADILVKITQKRRAGNYVI